MAAASSESAVLRRFAALLLVPLLLLLVLPRTLADVDTFEGPQVLVIAINKANAYTRTFDGPGSFARTVKVTLTTSVKLTRSLPALNATASLVIVGNCTKAGRPQRCVIDGAKKYSVFTTPAEYMVASRLTLRKLVFRKAKFGVFVDMFSVLNVHAVSFINNRGGVDLSSGFRPGGYPPRYFTGCTFTGNRGGVVLAGNIKYGLANSATGYRFRLCTFSWNTRGSVIQLVGSGTSVFDSVKFLRNSASSSGAALTLLATTAIIVNSTFMANTATSGNGAALYALSDFYGPVNISICSSKFQGNLAPKATVGRQIYVASPAGTSLPPLAGTGSVSVCGSKLPSGAGQVYFPKRKGWKVSIRTGSCPAGSCKV